MRTSKKKTAKKKTTKKTTKNVKTSTKKTTPKKVCGINKEGAMWYEASAMEVGKWYNENGKWFMKSPYGNVLIRDEKDDKLNRVIKKVMKNPKVGR